MYRIPTQLAIAASVVVAALVLGACQKIYSTQFVVPAAHSERLLHLVARVASTYGLQDDMANSMVKGAIAYYRLGDQKSGAVVTLGARTHQQSYVVDLFAWGGPVYDEVMVRAVELEIRRGLVEVYGEASLFVPDRKNAIPLDRSDT